MGRCDKYIVLMKLSKQVEESATIQRKCGQIVTVRPKIVDLGIFACTFFVCICVCVCTALVEDAQGEQLCCE